MIARLAVIAVAIAGFGYVDAVRDDVVEADRLARIGSVIAQGGAIGGAREILASVDEDAAPTCAFGIARNLALLRVAAEGPASDRAAESLRHSLRCQPADGLGWALLAEHLITAGDLNGGMEALDASRRFSPREGHVIVRRQFSSWPIYDLMPLDRQDATLDEFAMLVEGRYFPEALTIVQTSGEEQAETLGDALVTVSLLSRQLFAGFAYPRSETLQVPGIERPPR